MANKQANSIDYYTVDVGMMEDSKVLKVMAKHGWKEVMSFIHWILPLIYGEEGYYYQWDEDSSSLYALKSASDSVIGERILNSLIEKGFFNKILFEKYGIVTSKSVQRRYSIAVNRRKNVEIIKEYWVHTVAENFKMIPLNDNDVDVMYTSSEHNVNDGVGGVSESQTPSKHTTDSRRGDVNNSKQSKVKESKEKKLRKSKVLDIFLKEYPKQINRAKLEPVLMTFDGDLQELVDGVRRLKAYSEALKTEKQFIPNAENFIKYAHYHNPYEFTPPDNDEELEDDTELNSKLVYEQGGY